MDKRNVDVLYCRIKCIKLPLVFTTLFALFAKSIFAASVLPVSLDIISTLNFIQALLMQIGPILSAILFITAGIFYALGQLFPSYQRASFHTAAVDIIIGAIIVAVLSVASNGLALASTQLLSNTIVTT